MEVGDQTERGQTEQEGQADQADQADRADRADQADRADRADQASGLPPWDCMAKWTQAEREVWLMGPFRGGTPGMVRRIRRILDVSQRGLAALLDVSQSVVARWETGRTSPPMSVVERLLRMVRLRMDFHDEDTGQEVGPMRADGARTHGGSRYPAHTDLTATGWWVPRRLRSMTSVEAYEWVDRSRRTGDPAIGYRVSPFWKQMQRMIHGTPDDHPAVHQFVAEVRYRDERRADLKRERYGHAA